MLFVDNVDDLVQLYPLEAFENFFKIERNAKRLEHADIRARTNHFTVDKGTVTVKKYGFYLGHVISVLTSLTFS